MFQKASNQSGLGGQGSFAGVVEIDLRTRRKGRVEWDWEAVGHAEHDQDSKEVDIRKRGIRGKWEDQVGLLTALLGPLIAHCPVPQPMSLT